ncbi:MAG: beta-propeller domain-containing protein, partial [Candidatus Hydrogenedentes bacterium]|nr:beta-propeller domain-containing protein [Candidatus Hydrogenedentota bacterium]
MRKSALLFLIMAVSAATLTGCPWSPVRYRFTSADLFPNGMYRTDMPAATDGGNPSPAPGGAEEQARQVVEPDVIRQDGATLYVLNQYRGLTLVDLDSHAVLSQVPTLGYPRDLYIQGTRAYVLVAYATNYTTQGNTISFAIQSRLYVVDISNPAAAAVLSSYDLHGDLVDSRLVGDVLYAVGAEYQWSVALPGVVKSQLGTSWVTSVSIANPANIQQADQVSFDGTGTVIQATDAAIFVAAPDWQTGNSSITYVDIADPTGAMTVRGSIGVQGQIADRFKLDAYQGVLRVVSGGWDGQRQVYVTTVDLTDPDHLAQLAQTGLANAVGEQVFATRFDGAKAYIVSYLTRDPLFVVDLSDPAKPVVAGQLDLPGWSTHIEPRGNRLIALGVDDTNGRKISVSLFDVSNPAAPALIQRESFGGNWSWSNAYSDVKSFTALDNVIIVPFSGWEDNFAGYDRLQFLSYTPDSLQARGYVDMQGAVLRSFAYGGVYYGVTTEQLATIDGSDLDHPSVTNSLTLADNISDFVELTPSLGAEIITQYDSGETIVRTVALAAKSVGAAIGETTVSIGQLTAAYRYGASVVLAGVDWTNSSPQYRVAIVDCSVPATPAVTATLDVKVQPYYGYLPMPMYQAADSMRGGPVSSAVSNYWWFPMPLQQTTFLTGNKLLLRCVSDHYDVTLGSVTPAEGLAVVNLDTAAWTSTVGLGYSDIVSLNEAGGKLILGTKRETSYQGFKAMCAYFLRQIDIAALSAGPAANVPGEFIQYDAANKILTLRDFQWSAPYTFDNVLRTVSWDGSATATPLQSLTLPQSTVQTLGAGAKVFYDAYDSGYTVAAIPVSANGALGEVTSVQVTDQWGYLLAG